MLVFTLKHRNLICNAKKCSETKPRRIQGLSSISFYKSTDFNSRPLILTSKYNFVETPRKFIIAKLSVRKLGASSDIRTEDPSLLIKSFAIVNLRGVHTKLHLT